LTAIDLTRHDSWLNGDYLLGVPAQLIVYPGQHHIFRRPSFVKDLAERMSAWLGRFIQTL